MAENRRLLISKVYNLGVFFFFVNEEYSKGVILPTKGTQQQQQTPAQTNSATVRVTCCSELENRDKLETKEEGFLVML